MVSFTRRATLILSSDGAVLRETIEGHLTEPFVYFSSTAAATVLSAVYAYPPISIGDHLVEKVENYVDRMLKAALPGELFLSLVSNDDIC